MAERPVFVPQARSPELVREVKVHFSWFPGFAVAQKRRSIASLHDSCKSAGLDPVLEISSKSPSSLGRDLSAFRLVIALQDGSRMPVENAFQGSKVFEAGGPFTELYTCSPRAAKKDSRLRDSGELIAFRLLDEEFPLTPLTSFYDWLYVNALAQNPGLASHLTSYAAFTDIEFNPSRSLNCQARSAALYVALHDSGWLEAALGDSGHFRSLYRPEAESGKQLHLL